MLWCHVLRWHSLLLHKCKNKSRCFYWGGRPVHWGSILCQRSPRNPPPRDKRKCVQNVCWVSCGTRYKVVTTIPYQVNLDSSFYGHLCNLHRRPWMTSFLYFSKASPFDVPCRKSSTFPFSTTYKCLQTLVNKCWSWLTSNTPPWNPLIASIKASVVSRSKWFVGSVESSDNVHSC